MRLLVTGKETEGAFALVGSGGTADEPIGFHYHKEAHDVFLCIKGTMNVWANDQARELGPGDFASVPPVSFFFSLCGVGDIEWPWKRGFWIWGFVASWDLISRFSYYY